VRGYDSTLFGYIRNRRERRDPDDLPIGVEEPPREPELIRQDDRLEVRSPRPARVFATRIPRGAAQRVVQGAGRVNLQGLADRPAVKAVDALTVRDEHDVVCRQFDHPCVEDLGFRDRDNLPAPAGERDDPGSR